MAEDFWDFSSLGRRPLLAFLKTQCARAYELFWPDTPPTTLKNVLRFYIRKLWLDYTKKVRVLQCLVRLELDISQRCFGLVIYSSLMW